MKALKKAFRANVERFWKDEEAQGMIEYILILVAVVAIVTVAGRSIRDTISSRADGLSDDIGGVDFN